MVSLERVAILGASGWVGKTAGRLLDELGVGVLRFASQDRTEYINGKTYEYHSFDISRIREFSPTVVIDAAFITREKITDAPLGSYVKANKALIEQALEVQRLPSLERFIGVSSGAAVPHLKEVSPNFSLDPYGVLKATYEKRLKENLELRLKTTIARIWSVSGDLVTKPSLFAFSNLVRQAQSGSISIEAQHEVWRRYVDLEDYLKVALLAHPAHDRVIESGGELVEIGQLAELIMGVLGRPQIVKRQMIASLPGDNYFSDGASWQKSVDQLKFEPKSLKEQISRVAEALSKENHAS
jgi:nucleoside-diphosphate-sugar epimerase